MPRLALLALAMLAPGTAQEPGRPTPEDELVQLETLRSRAIRDADIKTLDEIYADDFSGVAGTGQLVDKPQLFAIFGQADASLRFMTSDVSARLFGLTGVVVGRLAGRREDGSLVSEARFTHVYVKREGRWKFVAGQSTPIVATDPGPIRMDASAAPRAALAGIEPFAPNAPGITPPRRVAPIKPQWPGGAGQSEALATLDIVVRGDGRVTIERTRRATDPAWEKACHDAVARWRYEPATKDGAPVAVRTSVSCTIHVR